MRAFILIPAALSLGACGGSQQSENTVDADSGLTAEHIVANDVTAIDAVTGDAANMAADVNYAEIDNLAGNDTNEQSPVRSRRPAAATPPATSRSPAADTAEPVAQPAGNTTEL